MFTNARRWLVLPVVLLIAGLGLFAFACDDDDDGGGASQEEIQEVEDLVRQLFGTDPTDQAAADFAFEHVTDNLIENVFFSTREECMANAVDCLGEPVPVESVSNTAIDGDTASTEVIAEFGAFQAGLVREDDVWKADSLQALSDELPEGAVAVDLSLTEFAFTLDAAQIPAAGSDWGFHVSNDGDQVHEAAVAAIPDDVTLEEALELDLEAAVVGLKLYIAPGQEVDMAFDQPLEAGRYMLVCFFPDTDDPEGTPHAFKGMLSEFTIE